MKKLNRKIEYSLMALKHMSQKIPGELTTAKEVSENYSTPFDATAKVLQLMAQKGLLKSEQGSSGGYQLTKDLSKVTLNDLMIIIEGPTNIVKCVTGKNNCEIKGHCNIISPVNNLNDLLTDFYKSVSLKDLLISPI